MTIRAPLRSRAPMREAGLKNGFDLDFRDTRPGCAAPPTEARPPNARRHEDAASAQPHRRRQHAVAEEMRHRALDP